MSRNSGDAPKDTVVLIHAAVVSRHSLALLAYRLKRLGFDVYNLGYPCRKLSVFESAEYLLPVFRDICSKVGGRVHVAGHSLGGLVGRRLLQLHKPPNFGRLVTLGTPHLGSPLANSLHYFIIFKKLFGPAGQELLTGMFIDWVAPWPPPYEIGLIAGSIPIGPGSFMLSRPHDGTVPQSSAQPAGGTAYARVFATHTTIPFLKKTAQLVAEFFKTGFFTTK